MAAGKTPSVTSVDRALHILELMACSESGLSLPQLTRRLDLPKSSTHCLLTTLERCGYVY
ncbi:MAG: helix-turn-helix domain-containing protein, partial [Acidobacteria bacterium]|nr:helix-turn-helix domain-containing protein [Acidobacteriota bacterium]